MENLTSKLVRIIFSVFLSLFVLSPVHGQASSSSIHVTHLTSVESDGPGGFKGVALTWDFILLDENGHVITNAEMDTAEISLQDGDSRDAQVNLSEVPWSIVLLVDAGLNMANSEAAFKDARQTLANSLEQLPDGSSIAVLKYSEEPTTVQKFTQDKKLAQKALLESISPDKSAKKSCLNNGVFEAINMLAGASSRRALLLLTASPDSCEDHSTAEVLKFAQENKVQIYGVGLEGQPVTMEQLEQLTGPSGGLSAIKNPDLVNFAFGAIFDPLKKQWQARATLYPTSAGQQLSKLTVRLKDKTSLISAQKAFTALRAYSPPPEIKLKGEVLPTFNGATFTLVIYSQTLIQKLDIFVENKKTGALEYSQINVKIPDTAQPAQFDLIIPKLVREDEYTLRVEAVDINGGKLQTVIQDFKYQPQGQIQIKVEPLTSDQSELSVGLESNNLGNIGKFKAWLVKECSNPDEVPGTQKDVPLGDAYTLSLNGLTTGTYHVAVQAVDLDNKVLMTVCDEQQPIQYVQPGWWAQTSRSLRQSPLAIAAFTILIVVVMVFLGWMVWAWRQRSVKPKAVPIHFPKVVINAPAPNLDMERSRELEKVLSARLPNARLSGILPSGAPVSAQIGKPTFTIGRAPENDLMIAVDKSAGVSRHHVTIQYASGRFYIEDKNSSYGTMLNDQAIERETRIPLEEGAVIQLGPNVKIKFSMKNSS